MTKYKFSKTLEKFLIALAEIGVAGFLAYATDKPYLLGLVPIAEGLRNFIKYKVKNA
jgi:hypothetical protein